MSARFREGTFRRMDAVLDEEINEPRAEFIRKAVDREIERRERLANRRSGK
jgi:hypothetical protein